MKSLIRNAYILGVLLLASMSIMGTTAIAADSHTVTNGAAPEIDEHGTCNKVTNSSGQSVMVPTKTTAEWSSFRSNPPSGISLASCAVVCPAGCSPSGGNCLCNGTGYNACPATWEHICGTGPTWFAGTARQCTIPAGYSYVSGSRKAYHHGGTPSCGYTTQGNFTFSFLISKN